MTAVSVVTLALLVWAFAPHIDGDPMAQDATQPLATQTGTPWQSWAPGMAEQIVAAGRPVFVDFTAAWCVTCQYNKKTTLANAEVLSDLASKNVALLRADWTRRDPAITAALAALGRSGVPVYVFYQAGKPPVVLTEVLSVQEVRSTIARL
jgi:thiol:disulfide interchange protein